MNKILYDIILIVVIIVLFSCTTNPMPKSSQILFSDYQPSFINSVNSTLTTDIDQNPSLVVCFDINVKELWQSGDSAAELNKHLAATSRFIFDDQSIVIDESTNSNLSFIIVYDENSEPIGSYSDLKLCYRILDVVIGEHTSIFAISNSSNTEYLVNFHIIIS